MGPACGTGMVGRIVMFEIDLRSPHIDVNFEQAEELKELVGIMLVGYGMHRFPLDGDLFEVVASSNRIHKAVDRHHCEDVEQVQLVRRGPEELGGGEEQCGAVDEVGVGRAVNERGCGPLGNVTDVGDHVVAVVRGDSGEREEEGGMVFRRACAVREQEVPSRIVNDQGIAEELDEGPVIALEYGRGDHEVRVLLPQVTKGLLSHREESELLEGDVEDCEDDAYVGVLLVPSPVEVEGVGRPRHHQGTDLGVVVAGCHHRLPVCWGSACVSN